MPWKPKSICNYPGCQSLTYDRYCEKHKKEMIRIQNDRTAKMYTFQWRKTSKEFLMKHPLCVHCEREGRFTPATEVDHIRPHGGVVIFSLVGVAHIIDQNIIGDGSAIRTAVIFFYLSNEGISIIENATRLGLPIPEKLRDILEQLKDGGDKDGTK